MDYIGKFLGNFKEFYKEINAATLTGAIDVLVVKQEDGSYLSSPFHVRFGKIGVLKSKEKVVDIEINGNPVDIHMKLGETGEAFFVEPLSEGEELSSADLATSPLPPSEPQVAVFDQLPVDGRQLDLNEPFVIGSVGEAQLADPSGDAAVSGTVSQLQVVDPEGTEQQMQSVDVHGRQGDTLVNARETVTSTSGPASSDPQTVTTEVSGDVTMAGSDTAITFKARRVEKLVKLDGSTMFVPIKNTEMVCATTQTERDGRDSSSSSSGRSQPVSSADSQNRASRKQRKQKKRRTPKHKRSLSETKAEPSEDNIFQMDDVKASDTRASRGSLDEWALKCLSSQPQDCHPFSDTDLSPPGSHHNSRSPSPIKSDTEFEIERERVVSDEGSQTDTTVWQWGELPSPSRALLPATPSPGPITAVQPPTPVPNSAQASDEERSLLSGLLTFMRRTKKARHDPRSEGLYLDDIDTSNTLDPKIAALYFPKSQAKLVPGTSVGAGGQVTPAVASPPLSAPASSSSGVPASRAGTSEPSLEEDEGNGSSLPQSPYSASPHSVEGAVGGRLMELGLSEPTDVAVSLCGGLKDCQEGDVPENLFLQCLVTFDDLCDDPRLLERPELVVRISGRYYNWQTAAPILASWAMFRRSLPQRVIDRLADQLMPKKKPPKKEESGMSRGYSWWSWRRRTEEQHQQEEEQVQPQVQIQEVQAHQDPIAETPAADAVPLPPISSEPQPQPQVEEPPSPPASEQPAEVEVKRQVVNLDEEGGPVVEEVTNTVPVAEEGAAAEGPTLPSTEPVGVPVTKQTAETQTGSPTHSSRWGTVRNAVLSSGEDGPTSESDDVAAEVLFSQSHQYKKTLRLTSERIEQLGLHEGKNEAVFSVTTAFQGTTRCQCNIFLWHYDDKIVVSDIDGTITRSDVLGHILPIIGQDWAQSGVAALFSKIRDNGYKFLYLSARAIGQAPITRGYLKSVRQGDLCLPEGPLLLSPSSLVSAFHREVIEKRPQDFKIPCLRDVQLLFPGRNPLYAGYGNRVNDALAYQTVNIPSSRIFTINHRGELRHELTQTFQSSYLCQTFEVDILFPPRFRPPPPEERRLEQFYSVDAGDSDAEAEEFAWVSDPGPAAASGPINIPRPAQTGIRT